MFYVYVMKLPGDQEFIKIFYLGQKDDIERNYKITNSETLLENTGDDNKIKKLFFFISFVQRNASISMDEQNFCRKPKCEQTNCQRLTYGKKTVK